MYKSWTQYMEARRSGETSGALGFGKPKHDRGDFNIYWCIALFFLTTTGYVILCRILVPDFPIVFILVYGYIWTCLLYTSRCV